MVAVDLGAILMSGEENCEKSLAPVGYVEAETFENECSRGVVKYGAGDGLAELPEGTPLFTADQFLDRLIEIGEEHRHRAEDGSAAGNEKERYACESVADVIHDEVMQWKLQIKEFTEGERRE